MIVYLAHINGAKGHEQMDVFETEAAAQEWVEGWIGESAEWHGAEYVSIAAAGHGRVLAWIARRAVRE